MKAHQEIWLLTHYRGALYSTIRNCLGLCGFDLEVVKAEFGRRGFTLRFLPYSQTDLRSGAFKGRLVVCQLGEDSGGLSGCSIRQREVNEKR